MKDNNRLQTISTRRNIVKNGFMLLAVGTVPGVASALGPGSRVADRGRRRIAKRHSVVAYKRANATQRAVALANARKAQEKLKKKWASSPAGRSYAKASGGSSGGSSSGGLFKKKAEPRSITNASPAKAAPSMATVVKDLKAPPVQAVPVPASPGSGARAAVIPVDLRTGGLVSSNVVEMARAPRAGSNVSNQVKAAVEDGTIQGNPNEWLRTDVVVASL
ncbi:hypothetical protein VSU19_13080 [Verrucomicrobiales bacterium BCK34]|nr:hypothetical protein [Verrucomicrobiales bacterium BCK34]